MSSGRGMVLPQLPFKVASAVPFSDVDLCTTILMDSMARCMASSLSIKGTCQLECATKVSIEEAIRVKSVDMRFFTTRSS